MYRGICYFPQKQLMRLFTWDEQGNRISYDASYEPYIYLETSGEAEAYSIFNTKLKKRSFRSSYDRHKYLEGSVSTRIFENLPPTQQYLVDTFNGQNESPEFSKFPLKVYYIDIEIDIAKGDGSFPEPEKADQPVNVITIYNSLTEKFYTWGTSPLSKPIENCEYVYCVTERDLFKQFLNFFEKDFPDLLSGFNSADFDIPYIVNRITNILGEDYVKRLSPSGRVYSRDAADRFGRHTTKWSIDGVACIDYLEIYRKFCTTLRENYKLNNIAEIEIGEGKVDFGGLSFKELAAADWDKFVEYNIQDVNLLVKMEKKLRYLELIRMIAYAGCAPFESALGTLSVVNGLCAVRARSRDQKIPTFNRDADADVKLEGGYVREPQRGFQEYIVTFDANSLYPNVMITVNISPETKIGKIINRENDKITIQHINGQEFQLTQEQFDKFIVKEQLAISKADVLFTQKKKGIVPDIEFLL